MKRIIAVSLSTAAVLLLPVLLPPPAAAQSVATWSLAGAACAPVGQTASGIGTFNSGGSVGFPEGKSGEIIVTCPVPSSIDRVSFLSVTYQDSDGPGTVAQVRASLRQKSLDTGGVSDVSGATIDSNAFPGSTVNVRRRKRICFGNSTPPLNHGRFTYYIQVNLTRRSSSAGASLSSVDLARVC